MGEPGGAGPIGPYPPGVDGPEAQDEYDRLRRRVLWTLPSGLYVVGSRAGERRNGMTINWVSQVSFEPKLLAISVEKTAFTHELITEGQVFALNTVSREDRAIVRKFTKPVDVDPAAMTLNGFPFHDGLTGLGHGVGALLDDDLARRRRAGDPHARSPAIAAASTGRAVPRSVTSAVTRAAGVTSNAGLRTAVPGSVSDTAPTIRTSSAWRSCCSRVRCTPSRRPSRC